MRLVTFEREGSLHIGAYGQQAGGGEGQPDPITLEQGALYDLTMAAERSGERADGLAEFLGEGPTGVERLQRLLSVAEREGLLAGDAVRVLSPIPRPGKLVCSAGNYQEHIKEGGADAVDKSKITPRLFLKPATSVIGPGEAIELPHWSKTVDWELELGVVIGRPGRNIPATRALEHVGGYVIFNDISARTLTLADAREYRAWDEFFDWANGKTFDAFAAMGPVLVTADEIPDPHQLQLTLQVNERVHQDGTTADMIFKVEELVAFASGLTTLEPGDVIATGTPSGVGAASDTYLAAGDVVVGSISGLGTLRNPVAAATDQPSDWRLPTVVAG